MSTVREWKVPLHYQYYDKDGNSITEIAITSDDIKQ